MEKQIKNEWELLEQKLKENSRKEFSGSIFGTKIKIEAVYDVILEFISQNTSIWGNMKKIPEFENENLSRDVFWRYFDFEKGIFSVLEL